MVYLDRDDFIKNEEEVIVNRVYAPAVKGFNRVNWNLRYPSFYAIDYDRNMDNEDEDNCDFTLQLNILQSNTSIPVIIVNDREGIDWEPYWKDKDTKLVHFIGKDNIVFHCIIFPAMLKAHGDYVLPAHGDYVFPLIQYARACPACD